MTTDELKSRVYRCIARKQEGDSWDFKKQWYDMDKPNDKGKACLLHDVICMANLIKDEDGIIIIGVDEEADYTIRDVTADPYRKNTNEMVKFLRDKPFDGGIRPTVYVESLDFEGKTIDVIVVENSSYTPYYLTQDCFKIVRAYHIYTRIGDTNTPVDRPVDRDKVEVLWKKRFGIEKPTLEKFRIYLRDYKNWISVDGEESWYYEFSPEFKIETEWDEHRNGYEYYCFSQIAHQPPSWHWVRLLYHETLMYKSLLVSLDGGNFMTAIPTNQKFFAWVPFDYYIEGDINQRLHIFLKEKGDWRDADGYMFSNWESIVPTFKSKSEADEFFKWVETQQFPDIEHYKGGYIPEKIAKTAEGEKYRDQFRQAEMLCDMLDKFRNTRV